MRRFLSWTINPQAYYCNVYDSIKSILQPFPSPYLQQRGALADRVPVRSLPPVDKFSEVSKTQEKDTNT